MQRYDEMVAEAQKEARDPALEIEVLLAAGSFVQLEAWLAVHEPTGTKERASAARAAIWVGKLSMAAGIIEADRLTQPDTPVLQLLAAKLELARGHYAQAAEQFARVPAGAAVSSEANHGLRSTLRAAGLSDLADDLP